MALPPLTPEERAAALAKGAEKRRERAALRSDITHGKLAVAAVFADEASPLQQDTAWRVLRAVPGIGDVKAGKMLQQAGVAPEMLKTRRIRGLGAHQRQSLLDQLGAA